jgi:hypothetical protein
VQSFAVDGIGEILYALNNLPQVEGQSGYDFENK